MDHVTQRERTERIPNGPGSGGSWFNSSRGPHRYMPPSHGLLCVPCAWHASDGPHRCTQGREKKWAELVKAFDDLFGQSAIEIRLCGRQHPARCEEEP